MSWFTISFILSFNSCFLIKFTLSAWKHKKYLKCIAAFTYLIVVWRLLIFYVSRLRIYFYFSLAVYRNRLNNHFHIYSSYWNWFNHFFVIFFHCSSVKSFFVFIVVNLYSLRYVSEIKVKKGSIELCPLVLHKNLIVRVTNWRQMLVVTLHIQSLFMSLIDLYVAAKKKNKMSQR